MSILRLAFAGNIKGEVKTRLAAGKELAEVSICKKNRKIKDDDEDSFTWIRVSIWGVQDFQLQKLVTGAFIAGTGDLTMRSYIDKEGVKKSALEIRCQSFDVEISDGATTSTAPRPAPAPRRPAPAQPIDDSEPPF